MKFRSISQRRQPEILSKATKDSFSLIWLRFTCFNLADFDNFFTLKLSR